MVEINYEISDIFASISNELEKEIKEKQESISNKQAKIDDTAKKIGTFEKMGLNIDIKRYKEEIVGLTKLKQAIFDFYSKSISSSKYSLPEQLKEEITGLCSRLDNQDAEVLKSVVNECVRAVDRENRQSLNKSAEQVQKLLEQLDYAKRNIMVYSNGQIESSYLYKGIINYKKFIEDYLGQKKGELLPEHVFIRDTNPVEIKPDFTTEMMLNKLTEMINNKQLEITKNNKNIIENIDQIRDMFYRQAKLNYALLCMTNTLSTLNNIADPKLEQIKSTLLQLQSKYKTELEKVNKNLGKFDFTDVKNQVEEQKEKEEKDREHEQQTNIIKNLAYEIEKAKTENPNDYQHISELEEQLRQAMMSSPLSKDEIDKARFNGQEQYRTESAIEQSKVNKAKAEVEYEDQLKRDVMIQIREYAIQELERSGAFDESYEYRDGDVRSVPMDKEVMIQRKIEELQRLAELTPEQRGLEDLKRHGQIPSDANIEDLTPTQLNDIRIGYSDSSYEFMADYKSWKARESVKPLANNIFKEYLKYRASLQDKTQFLSFSDYAKQMHNVEQMSGTMVDQDLREELKGMSR